MAFARFFPRDHADDAWIPMPAQRAFAIRCNVDEPVFFRFGQGHGIYISVAPATAGRLAHTIDFETGDQTLIGKVTEGSRVMIGRTSDCSIKIMHAIVSRQHLELVLMGNVLMARDVGSTNGSFYYRDLVAFDIDQYLDSHPIDQDAESTMDAIHEAFGPTLGDFLKAYSEKKGQLP